jgi:hypothetical protein
MTPFDAYDLIALWERDRSGLPVAEKALLLLALARPHAARDALGAMPIGARDRALLELRASLFGARLQALASCHQCNEQLELELHVGDFLAGVAPVDAAAPASLVAGDIDLRVRLPTTDDAVLVAHLSDGGEARRALVRRCILDAARDGAPVAFDDLGDDVITRVSQAMESLDPLSEIRLELTCSSCENSQSVLLEIASYLWAELVSEAERLLEDVRLLAHRYGWREADILAMSGKRRQFYLDRMSTT